MWRVVHGDPCLPNLWYTVVGTYCKLYFGLLIVSLKQIGYGVHGDLDKIQPEPYSIYLRGTIISCLCR